MSTDTDDRKRYYVEPVALIFNEDNYYLMAYISKHPESTANYRIDRMDHVEVVEEPAMSDEALAKLEGVADYTEQVFKMFDGEREDVVLQFDKALIGPAFDKFGEDTPMEVIDDSTCEATVLVQVSPTFFGWLARFGGQMIILKPECVSEAFLEHISRAIDLQFE